MRNHVYAGLITAAIFSALAGMAVSEAVRFYVVVGLGGVCASVFVVGVYFVVLSIIEDRNGQQ